MKIVATTEDGYLIQATSNETKEILTSVNGIRPKEIEIGQKIPALDYATTITKLKALKDDFKFTQMYVYLEEFYEMAKNLKDIVTKANDI